MNQPLVPALGIPDDQQEDRTDKRQCDHEAQHGHYRHT